MKAGLLIIGDEILSGKTVDTNSAYLGQKLTEAGFIVKKKLTVGDDKNEIKKAFRELMKDEDIKIILTTGGLGPTKDDLTKGAITEYLGLKLIYRDEIYEKIKERFEKRGLKCPDINRSQAYIPEGAKILENELGTAPGLIIEKEGKIVIMMPGVPKEMKNMFEKEGLTYLIQKLKPKKKIYSKILRTTGIPESEIQEKLRDFEGLAYLPKFTGVDIKVSAISEKELNEKVEKIKEILGNYIYGEDEQKLEEVIGKLLKERGLKIGVAESCTGGLIKDRITDVPGSSNYFMGGVVAYSNEMKMKVLGVREESLMKWGAVSEQVAIEMAEGVKKVADADIGLSTTGIAGPTGATPTKPVGLVYIGIATPDYSKAYKYIFSGDRRMIKEKAAQEALNILRLYLLSK